MSTKGLPIEITEYVDLKSPILKYLLEIEKKHWASQTNQTYKLQKKSFSRKSSDELEKDSESSIQSLKGVTTYKLETQNHSKHRQEPKCLYKQVVESSGRDGASGFRSQPRGHKNESSKKLMIDFKETTRNKGKIVELLGFDQLELSKTKYEGSSGYKSPSLQKAKSKIGSNDHFEDSLWQKQKEKIKLKLNQREPKTQNKLSSHGITSSGPFYYPTMDSKRNPRSGLKPTSSKLLSNSKIMVSSNKYPASTVFKGSNFPQRGSPREISRHAARVHAAHFETNRSGLTTSRHLFGSPTQRNEHNHSSGLLKKGLPSAKKPSSPRTSSYLSNSNYILSGNKLRLAQNSSSTTTNNNINSQPSLHSKPRTYGDLSSKIHLKALNNPSHISYIREPPFGLQSPKTLSKGSFSPRQPQTFSKGLLGPEKIKTKTNSSAAWKSSGQLFGQIRDKLRERDKR